MDTCIYEIDYQYFSSCTTAFDVTHMRALVEAPRGINRDMLSKLCCQKIYGFGHLNAFKEAHITKLV